MRCGRKTGVRIDYAKQHKGTSARGNQLRVASLRNLRTSADISRNSIHLLMAGCEQFLANTIVVTMRGAGIAVTATQSEDIHELKRLLSEGTHDLVLIGFFDDRDVRQAVLHVRRADADCGIVLLADDIAPDVFALASDLGIRDVVSPKDTPRLIMVISREYETLRLRRELAGARQRLADAEQRCDTLTTKSQDAVCYVHDGMHVRTNPAYLNLFGIADETQLDDTPLMDLIAPSDRPALKEVLRKLGDGNQQQTLDTRCLHRSGRGFSATLEFHPASVDGERCIQIVIRQSRAGYPVIEPPAVDATDPLTGFLTRKAVNDYIEVNFAQDIRHGPVGLVMVNLTGLTRVKNELSLDEADNRLRRLARALKHALAPRKIMIARFSDNEFALYVTSDNPNAIAYKTMHVLTQQAAVWKESSTMSEICMGVVNTTDEDIASARVLVKNACVALRQAEEQGGGIVLYRSFARTDSTSPGPIDSELVELINCALEQDRFRLKFQPIISLHGDTREYYAVFIRLLDNRNVELLPAVFLDQAERTDRLSSIDRWVIRHAIRELARQRREGRKVVFFVSVSHASITDDSFLLWVCECLRDARAKGSWLVFQFKEADLLEFNERARPLLEGLRKINCRVAMDNFSDVAQSMLLLEQINIDFVKLSSVFMRDLSTDEERRTRFAEINASLKERGMRTVATAVEDANSLAMLWNVGVNYIQGYFLQKPANSIVCEFDA